jgi:hypothetical protein
MLFSSIHISYVHVRFVLWIVFIYETFLSLKTMFVDDKHCYHYYEHNFIFILRVIGLFQPSSIHSYLVGCT